MNYYRTQEELNQELDHLRTWLSPEDELTWDYVPEYNANQELEDWWLIRINGWPQ